MTPSSPWYSTASQRSSSWSNGFISRCLDKDLTLVNALYVTSLTAFLCQRWVVVLTDLIVCSGSTNFTQRGSRVQPADTMNKLSAFYTYWIKHWPERNTWSVINGMSSSERPPLWLLFALEDPLLMPHPARLLISRLFHGTRCSHLHSVTSSWAWRSRRTTQRTTRGISAWLRDPPSQRFWLTSRRPWWVVTKCRWLLTGHQVNTNPPCGNAWHVEEQKAKNCPWWRKLELA